MRWSSISLPACQEFRNVVMTARTYGGAVKRSVFTSFWPRVLTTVLHHVSRSQRPHWGNLRKEVSDSPCRDDSEEQKHQDISLDVWEGKLEANDEWLVFAVQPVVLSHIFFKTPNCEFSFLHREPRSCSWEVGEDPLDRKAVSVGSLSLYVFKESEYIENGKDGCDSIRARHLQMLQ